MKCSICGNETTHSYKVYCEASDLQKDSGKKLSPGSLTGKAQMIQLHGENFFYLEHNIPLCHKCVYLSQLRFNAIAALISGIIGALLLHYVSAKFLGIILLLFCAGNVIFGLVQFIRYLRDNPYENIAVSEFNEYCNKGLTADQKGAFYSFEKLKDHMGKLGTIKPYKLSPGELEQLLNNGLGCTATINKASLPTCWVFGCYDRERVQGLSIFQSKADFYSEVSIKKMVREQLHIPSLLTVNYIAPPEWDAPDIQATTDSFNCDMDNIDGKVNTYLISKTGCDKDKPRDAMKTTMPYPNAGLLLIIVNMEA
ncbi:MAG: hypothetical protein VB051_12760 [Candidatus Pelethousia sp.]|nr:hypothetical protein [Candidatus Pelethousia sp.]